MIVHHISLAFRHLAKHQTISLLNFFGLATGLATAMIIGLHVRHEWQTDGFVPHAERVYRAIRESAIEGKPYDIGITSPNYSGALQQDFGEKIEATTRFYPDHIYISVGDKRFHERKFTYADPNFFQFFNQKLLLGDAATALANPGSVVLTRATANKLFGSPEAALHQHIRWNNERDLLVTGVADDFPANTHLEYDYVCALSMFKDAGWFKQWWNNNLCTHVRLAPGVTATF